MSHNVKRMLSGNKHALKHGGAAAVKAIQTGLPFTEHTAIVQDELEREFDTAGVYEFIKIRALRLATAEQIYWRAAQLAGECGDVEKYEGRIKTWGWLIMAELRALDQLNKIDMGKGTLDAVLEAYVEAEQLQGEGGSSQEAPVGDKQPELEQNTP